MAKNNFVMNFYGPVGEHIDTVKEMTVNIGGDGCRIAICDELEA